MSNSFEELKAAADKAGLKYHPNISEETLRARLNQQPKAVIEDALKHPTQVVGVVDVVYNTKEEVLEVIKPFMDKGMVATFNEDEHTWYFSYNGRDECGNMSAPLRVIRMKAENVSKGRLAMNAYKDEDGLCFRA